MRNLKQSAILPLMLFAIATMVMGVNGGIYDTSFNNYLAQVHHVSAVARGGLEFPRELPGFLVVFVYTALLSLADTRIAAISALLVGITIWGQGYLTPGMGSVVIWMLIWSTGSHLLFAISPAITIRLAKKGEEGKRLGQLGFMEAVGTLLGMALVYVGVTRFSLSFAVLFGISGSCALIAALLLFTIKPQTVKRKHKLVLKKKYSLFYLLNILFGARKQIFLTFAPWVLIQVFHEGVATFAMLGFIGTVIALFFRPLLGKAIDAWGERKIIIAESVVLILICILYGFAENWFSRQIALTIIMGCYITDMLLFAVRMARATYLNRILEDPSDLAPTISMGISMDHAVSMIVPFGGGLLWTHYGYLWVFMVAAFIALLDLIAALAIPDRVPGKQSVTKAT